jgi:hypothetical protein
MTVDGKLQVWGKVFTSEQSAKKFVADAIRKVQVEMGDRDPEVDIFAPDDDKWFRNGEGDWQLDGFAEITYKITAAEVCE